MEPGRRQLHIYDIKVSQYDPTDGTLMHVEISIFFAAVNPAKKMRFKCNIDTSFKKNAAVDDAVGG